VVQIPTAIEDHFLDALVLGAIAISLPTSFAEARLPRWPFVALDPLPFSTDVAATRLHPSLVDDLCIDMVHRAIYIEPRSLVVPISFLRIRVCTSAVSVF